MFYEPFSCGCAQKYMKTFRIGFLNYFFFFPFYFCCRVPRVTPYRLSASCMCVCLRGELLPFTCYPTPSLSQTCYAPCWPDVMVFCFSSPSVQTQDLFCHPPWMFSVPPLLSPWPQCWGLFKGAPFPHLLSDHLAQERLFYPLSSCLVGI